MWRKDNLGQTLNTHKEYSLIFLYVNIIYLCLSAGRIYSGLLRPMEWNNTDQGCIWNETTRYPFIARIYRITCLVNEPHPIYLPEMYKISVFRNTIFFCIKSLTKVLGLLLTYIESATRTWGQASLIKVDVYTNK